MKSISPVAPRTMMTIAASCFLAGLLLGAWIIHLVSTKRAECFRRQGRSTYRKSFPRRSSAYWTATLFKRSLPAILSMPFASQVSTPLKAAQPFGRQSTQHLSELIFGKTVNLECKNERDDYGRLVCKILLQPRGEDVCLDQLKAGLAWHYK